MYSLIEISDPKDIDSIEKLLDSEYQPNRVTTFLRDTLSLDVKAIIVESPYVDKDYRSTYYHFYAKKGLRYNPFCVRIHCFGDIPKLSKDLELRHRMGYGYDLSNEYLGFCVVRPIEMNPIGRTVLDPRAIRNFRGRVIRSEHVVHLLGNRLIVKGFPYMQQHTDISVCAHVACWSILRHYSQRFNRHAEYLTHDITLMSSPLDPGGLLPSRGLQVEHARTILGEGGAYPDIYEKSSLRNNDDAQFYRCLFAYVASGFPIFAAMHKREHAITVVGYGPEQGVTPAIKAKKQEFKYAWDYVGSLIVMDDNHPPYRTIGMAKSPKIDYTLKDIDTFIVPLPDKVYFPAEGVMEHVENLLSNSGPFSFNFIKEPVIRFLLATSARLKRHMLDRRSEFPGTFFTACMELSMPQFVWLVEIADLTDWNRGVCNLRFIYDATANTHELAPFFVIHDQNKAFIYDRSITRELGLIQFGQNPISSLGLYNENLDQVLVKGTATHKK